MPDRPPYTRPFDLASLGEAEKVIALRPNESERAAIATWANVEGLDSLEASIRLRRAGDDRYEYDASFDADVTQACVVTLDPVHSHLSGTASRRFRVMPKRGRRRAPVEDAATDVADDDTESLTSGILDLAAPLLEELALAIDPYPRAPGAVFEGPADADKPVNPFAKLERLKRKG